MNRETIVAICEKIWQYTDKSHFVLLRLLGGEWYLADHLRASQPARAKSTIHLCGIYLCSILFIFNLQILQIYQSWKTSICHSFDLVFCKTSGKILKKKLLIFKWGSNKLWLRYRKIFSETSEGLTLGHMTIPVNNETRRVWMAACLYHPVLSRDPLVNSDF